MQNFRAAKKQLNTDLEATTPDGSLLAADAAAVTSAKAQLKAARTQLNSALLRSAHTGAFAAASGSAHSTVSEKVRCEDRSSPF